MSRLVPASVPRARAVVARSAAAALFFAITGCGRLWFDPLAGDLELACDWSNGPSFEAPVRLGELSSPEREAQPYLSDDGVTLYFASERAGGLGGFDLYRAVRPARSLPFGPPQPIAELNSVEGEFGIAFAPGELAAFVASNRPGTTGGSDIWSVERPARDAPFGALSPVAAVNTFDHEWDPFLPADGLSMYLVAYTPTSSVVVTVRSSVDQPFDAPFTVVPRISSDDNEGNPSLTRDGRHLVFNRNTQGTQTSDIFYGTRSSTAEPFGEPQPVPGVNAAGQEGEPFVTPDGCELFFTSDRGGATDLYLARFSSETL